MKNLKRILLLLLSILSITFFAFACNSTTENNSSQSSITSEQGSSSLNDSTTSGNSSQSLINSSSSIQNSSSNNNSSNSEEKEISFKTLTLNGTSVYGKVSNDTIIFSFLDEISTSSNISYIICTDLECKNSIPSKTTSLEIGDNNFYLLLQSENKLELYTIIIRRLPLVTVSFNTNGGEKINAVTVEEGTIISSPLPQKAGYTFIKWNYDFSKPITSNFTAIASWQANTNTPYRIEYYFENTSLNGYTINSSLTKNLTGTTDSIVYADIIDFESFVPVSESVSAVVKGDGSTVLKVQYNKFRYTVIFNGNGGTLQSGSSVQNILPGNIATAPIFERPLYVFSGWKLDNELVSTSADYSFEVNDSVELVAQWTLFTPDSKLLYCNELKLDVSNPSVIYNEKEKCFYTYGDSSELDYKGFLVWKSEDLTNWQNKGTIYLANQTNHWAYTNYTAPNIFYDIEGIKINNEIFNYFLFYSADLYNEETSSLGSENVNSTKCMSVLYAKHPSGPFYHPDNIENAYGQVLSIASPVFDFSYNNNKIPSDLRCDNTVDAFPFIDTNGEKYLYYSGWDLETKTNAKQQCIYGVKMIDWFTPDYSTVSKLTEVGFTSINGDKIDWESMNESKAINEAPFMYKDGDTYMLTFSVYDSNLIENQVRLATSSNPLTGFEKIAPNDGGTVIRTVAEWDGVVQSAGHHYFVTVGDELFIAYHTFKNRTNISQGRALAFDRVTIKEHKGKKIFVTNGPSYSYQALPSALSGYDNIASQATITGDILSNKEALTDGLVKYHNDLDIGAVATEVDMSANGKITLDFGNNYHNVRAIMVHLSSVYNGGFNRISKATLTYKSTSGDKKVEITNAHYDLDKYYDFEVGIIKQAGGTAIIEFDVLPVNKIELEFDSWGDNFKLNEIEILATIT